MQFKEAVRSYQACRPFCVSGDAQRTLTCFGKPYPTQSSAVARIETLRTNCE
jgi:hypothetical protein